MTYPKVLILGETRWEQVDSYGFFSCDETSEELHEELLVKMGAEPEEAGEIEMPRERIDAWGNKSVYTEDDGAFYQWVKKITDAVNEIRRER